MKSTSGALALMCRGRGHSTKRYRWMTVRALIGSSSNLTAATSASAAHPFA
jgi:hypothetical protein